MLVGVDDSPAAREVWKISAVIEATPEDADAAMEAIARALCPDEHHEGPCPVPWVTMQVRFDDLDDDQRRMWQESFDADRAAFGEAPTP